MIKDNSILQGLKIKIFTRSFSLEMYEMSKYLFESMGVSCIRLTDQMADGYFYTMLKDKECDIAINIDEDAFVISPKAILSLVEYVVENNYANAGCPDGGCGAPRYGNPIITNPFFNVLNLKLIRTIAHSKQDVKQFDYLKNRDEMESKFPKEILFGKFDYGKFDYEPYYPFFFWLANNFKTLYLPSNFHTDGVSTILYNHTNEEILYHSWFARFYKIKSEQTRRIKNLFEEVIMMREMKDIEYTKLDIFRFSIDFFMRRLIRIPMRIANWPNKWKKWYKHNQVTKNK